VLSDRWEGLDAFFEPGSEILLVGSTEEATAALDLDPAQTRHIGEAARRRVLSAHTSAHRAAELLALLSEPPRRSSARRLARA
jgi:spore maturation protein CgeB